jgi:hypothetical protein
MELVVTQPGNFKSQLLDGSEPQRKILQATQHNHWQGTEGGAGSHAVWLVGCSEWSGLQAKSCKPVRQPAMYWGVVVERSQGSEQQAG